MEYNPINRREPDAPVRQVQGMMMVSSPGGERGYQRPEVIALGGNPDKAAARIGGKWEVVYGTRYGFNNAGSKSGVGLLGTLKGERVVLRSHHDKQSLWRVGPSIFETNWYITATPASKLRLSRRDGEWWLEE